MKNSIKLLIAFVGLLSISCTEDVQDTPAATPDSSLKLLSPNSSFNLVLDGAKLDNVATTFVWQDPKSPNDESVAYTVEAAVGGSNFAAPITLGTTTGHFLDLTVGQLDAAAKMLGLEPLVEGQMDVRITNVSESSNFFTLKVTPYQPHWGIIGSATPHGWDSSTDMAFNPMTGKYSISLALITGELKFRLDNAWTTNFGDDGNNLSLEPGGANIPVTAGNYTIVLDVENRSYTITPITSAWGIIGSATPTGWDNDSLMDFNPVSNTYSVVMHLKVGEFKFRLNHDWGTNYGDNGNDLSLDNGGSNIPVANEGDYYITTDFNGLTYTVTQLN